MVWIWNRKLSTFYSAFWCFSTHDIQRKVFVFVFKMWHLTITQLCFTVWEDFSHLDAFIILQLLIWFFKVEGLRLTSVSNMKTFGFFISSCQATVQPSSFCLHVKGDPSDRLLPTPYETRLSLCSLPIRGLFFFSSQQTDLPLDLYPERHSLSNTFIIPLSK